ncbi:unnamed protein product [Clonostachys rhizophaga]|uniref:Uncharacterized protein n=1 Tax=Clonostachys rhizophaga TaxID=160324 RepID=A0A9N9VVQ3_9HYPO|nr:unnamed protein product [Clonostachys rhizophaga]
MDWTYISQTLLGVIYFILFLLSLNVAFDIAIITHRALGCKLGGILSRLWWMRCSAVILFTWHVAFLAGVLLDLYSPKYWNFDTISQQETRISNILLADELCYRQMIIGEIWFCVLSFSYLQTRYLRAAMLHLVPVTIGILLREWAKKSEIPDLSPSGDIWGSVCIIIQLFLAMHLWKQSPKVDGGMRDNEKGCVSACDLYDRAQHRKRNGADRWKPSFGWKLFNISLWKGQSPL